jgi:hypothetical protein
MVSTAQGVRPPWHGRRNPRRGIKRVEEEDGVCKKREEMAVAEECLGFALKLPIYRRQRQMGP